MSSNSAINRLIEAMSSNDKITLGVDTFVQMAKEVDRAEMTATHVQSDMKKKFNEVRRLLQILFDESPESFQRAVDSYNNEDRGFWAELSSDGSIQFEVLK